MLLERIDHRWNRIVSRFSDTLDYWYLTPTNYAMFKIIKRHLEGKKYEKVLDLGAGNLAFRTLLQDSAGRYISLDVKKTSTDLDVVCSGTNISFKDNSFDAVICSAVLEHTIEPQLVLQESYRVLRRGGYLIATVPHLHYEHGEPEDYWRFTRFGIQKLVEHHATGYVLQDIIEVGYLFNFLASLMLPAFFGLLPGNIRPYSRLMFLWKSLTVFLEKLDRSTGLSKLALGYVVIAKKE